MLFALAEAVFIVALLAGGGYLISPEGAGALPGLSAMMSGRGTPRGAGQPVADSAAGRAPVDAAAEKPKRADSGKGRAGLAERLGTPEFSGGASGLLLVSLQGAKPGADTPPVSGSSAKPVPMPSPKPAAPPKPETAAQPLAAPRALEPESAPQPQKQQPQRNPPAVQAAAQPKPPAALTLPNVHGRLADRPDLEVSMSVEMQFENDAALRWEILYKQDILAIAAGAALRKHEYGRVNTAILKADILKTINGQLQAGKLSNVNILDFQAGQSKN